MVPVAEQRAENVSGVLEPIIDGDHRAAMTAGRIFQHFQLGRLMYGGPMLKVRRRQAGRSIIGTRGSGGGQLARRCAYRGSSVAAMDRTLPARVFR